MIIGYARVSTDRQSLDAQHATLTAGGAEKVFADKVSGIGLEPWYRFAIFSKAICPSVFGLIYLIGMS